MDVLLVKNHVFLANMKRFKHLQRRMTIILLPVCSSCTALRKLLFSQKLRNKPFPGLQHRKEHEINLTVLPSNPIEPPTGFLIFSLQRQRRISAKVLCDFLRAFLHSYGKHGDQLFSRHFSFKCLATPIAIYVGTNKGKGGMAR